MGTAVSIDVPDETDTALLEEVRAWLHWVHDTFTVHNDDSPINRVGQGEVDLDEVPAEIRHVVTQCDRLVEMTDGAFDHRPANRSDRPLDPSAYVKGWCLDEAARRLRLAGVERFALGAGGDIVCSAGAGDPWQVGLQHPSEPDRVAAVFGLTDHAIATSGRYARGDHVWSSETSGGDKHELVSVSVIGTELAIADSLATALLGADEMWPSWMNRFPGHEVVAITANEKRHMTEGARALLAPGL